MFEPDSRCWRTPTCFRVVKQETRGTQTTSEDLAPPTRTTGHAQTAPTHTPSSALALYSAMLPCGVPREPRPLFYGNAGFRLHFPARFELPGNQEEEARPPREEREQMQARQWEEEAEPERQIARSVEVRIGQKLQLIGDQFHSERVLLHRLNQRNEAGPLWWRLASTMFSLLFERELEAAAWR